MASNAPKTVPNHLDVDDVIGALVDERQQHDSRTLVDMMRRVSGEDPVMWGSAIIGFGARTLTYASGRQADWPLIAFSPRKGKLALYVTDDAEDHVEELAEIGKTSVGKACIYVRRLGDVDLEALERFVERCYEHAVADARDEITSATST